MRSTIWKESCRRLSGFPTSTCLQQQADIDSAKRARLQSSFEDGYAKILSDLEWLRTHPAFEDFLVDEDGPLYDLKRLERGLYQVAVTSPPKQSTAFETIECLSWESFNS